MDNDQLEWLGLLRQQRAIAVIRAARLEVGRQMAHAVAAGGMGLIEITWNSDRPANLIAELRQTLPQCRIGAGTLLNQADMQAAIAAGATFLFTPHCDPSLIQFARSRQRPIVPGCLSPTEIVTAWQSGASSVKVFPVQAVGGTSYLQALREPLGQIPLIPTGGITLDNAAAFIRAGAIAVGIASDLFPKDLVTAQDWSAISERAKRLIQSLRPDSFAAASAWAPTPPGWHGNHPEL